MQSKTTARRNFFWPLLVIALGALALAQALEAFPPIIADLVSRAWPVVLVLIGLTFLLEQIPGLRRVAGLIALVLSAVVLGVIINTAYAIRAGTERADNVVQFQEVVEETVQELRVVVVGLETTVEISPAVPDVQSLVIAEFIGSTESQVQPTYEVGENGIARLTIEETRPNAIPALETVGRGRLRVELPMGLPVALDFTNASGTVSLNLLGLDITRLDVIMQEGDLLLSLPNNELDRRAEVFLARGAVTVFVPDDLGVALTTNGKEPQFAQGAYLVDTSSGAYLSRRYDSAEVQLELNINAGGTIRLE